MDIAMIGLGKMGFNMSVRLLQGKHKVVVYDVNAAVVNDLAGQGATAAKSLVPENGYMYCGASGSGHFTKMVHNGIEYGMMQAYAEGFELMQKSGFDLDLPKIADLWGQGSVVRSWLLELLADALKKDPKLE